MLASKAAAKSSLRLFMVMMVSSAVNRQWGYSNIRAIEGGIQSYVWIVAIGADDRVESEVSDTFCGQA